jgi:hypothetical protein
VFTENKTYILYCQSDWRGVLAAATLKETGLPNVFHLAGGYSEWRKAGAPTGKRKGTPISRYPVKRVSMSSAALAANFSPYILAAAASEPRPFLHFMAANESRQTPIWFKRWALPLPSPWRRSRPRRTLVPRRVQ